MTDWYTDLAASHAVEKLLEDSRQGLTIDEIATATDLEASVVLTALVDLRDLEAMVTETATGTWRHTLHCRHSAAHNAVAA